MNVTLALDMDIDPTMRGAVGLLRSARILRHFSLLSSHRPCDGLVGGLAPLRLLAPAPARADTRLIFSKTNKKLKLII
jgi:hypothetical protein